MATLSLKNINKVYPNGVQAVFDFNLEIKDKEFIVFVGPSGCGKSTTLRMVAGLEEITTGELYIDSLLMNNVAPKDRNIAMVFQSYALYPHMTVYNNMKFSLKLRKLPMPVYEEYDSAKEIIEDNAKIRKEIAKLDKQFKKKQDASDLLIPRAALYKKLYENEEKIKSVLKQKVGIDLEQIKSLNALIKKLENDIKAGEKLLAKNNLTEYDTNNIKTGNEIKAKQIDQYKEQISYLEKNEIPLNTVRYLNKDEIDLEINKVAESIDLVRYLFRKPSALSGGQRQRVALGRAMVRKPKVFLMDEPLSNLDAKLRVQTRSEISKIHKNVGATTIYVTHDQTEAMTMADRIVIMKDGHVQQIGTPDEVFNDPSNKFVAGFIGSPSMNFLLGTVKGNKFILKNETKNDGDLYSCKSVDDVVMALPKRYADMLKQYQDKDVYVGIRPEHMFLENDPNNHDPAEPIKCVCDFDELLGTEIVIYTYWCGQRVVLKTNAANKVKAGDKISVSFEKCHAYFFDAETELRIR